MLLNPRTSRYIIVSLMILSIFWTIAVMAQTEPNSVDDTSENKIFLPLVQKAGPEADLDHAQEDNREDGLFIPITDTVTSTSLISLLVDSPTIVRSRLVTIRFDQLTSNPLVQVQNASSNNNSNRLTLNLFDDVVEVALLDQVISNASGSISWIGYLEDRPLSQVILTVHNQLMHGSIIFPGGVYGIRQVNGEMHLINQINQGAFPGDDVTLVQNEQTIVEPASINELATDDGSVIDVLVAYTDDARAGAGNRANIEALINTAANQTNDSYADSGVSQRIRLVDTVEVSYAETQISAIDVDNLRNGNAGLQIVRDLRNAYAADLVIMITETLDPDTCGQAFDVMSTVTTNFGSDAYAVVRRDCVDTNLSFPHELAHLMGARHDWYVDDTNNSPYTFNHGFVVTPTLPVVVRTIMAYVDECADRIPNFNQATQCTRIARWSNPAIPFNAGTPTLPNMLTLGVAAGTNTSCTAGNVSNPNCDSVEFDALNRTAATVANFVPGNLSAVRVRTQCRMVLGQCVEDGSSTSPFDTLTEGVFRTAPNGTVTIEAGTYLETLVLVTKNPRGLTLNRPMTLQATGGTVTIGQ